MRFGACLLLVLLLGAGPAWAGVVDDAEEVLQEVETDGPGVRALRAAPGTSSPSFNSGNSTYSGSSSSTSTRTGGSRDVRSRGGSGASGGEELDKDKESPPRRRNRDSKQTAKSFAGLMLLLGLVLAGAVAGRKLAASGGSDD